MTSELRFDGRVVTITGAHHGLGRAHAELLARRGARLVVNDLQGAAETVAAIRDAGGEAVENTSDITTPAGTDRIVADALDAWGRLDVIVNNAAGGLTTTLGEDAGSRACVDVHFFGTQNLMRSALPVFREQNYGRIVNTGSGSVMGIPMTGSYAAAKGAVLALSKVLANELRATPDVDIRVNVLLPAAQTPNFPPVPDERIQAILQVAFAAEQCSPVVAVLAHESCPVQGEALQVGGGRVSRLVLATTEGWQGPDGGLTPENVVDHWAEIVAPRDLREPVGSMADIFGRRGEHPYTAMEIFRWGTTGEAPGPAPDTTGTAS